MRPCAPVALLACAIGLAPLAFAAEEAEPADVAPPAEENEVHLDWSSTFIVSGKLIAPAQANDGVGGFFDQYEFTPNKSNPFPIELGVRDAAIDVLREHDDAIFQLRLRSPTSNLGVSGSQIDQPFFNQQVDTWTRTGEWELDLGYRRMRTEQLRRFPNTEGAALVFQDQTLQDARFARDRTGLAGEARRRFGGLPGDDDREGGGLASEIAVRGGFDARSGLNQLRTHVGPANEWFGLPQGDERNVSAVGGGALAGSRDSEAWLVTLDFDYEQLRWKSPTLFEGQLGAPPPADVRTLGFIPDSDRFTGRIESRGRVAQDVVWDLGYQLSVLEQVGERTPDQVAAGLDQNQVFVHSVGGGVSWSPWVPLTLLVDVDFDYRDNRIDRDTPLFNASNGTQVDAFVDDWRRLVARFEAETRFWRRNTFTLGVRYDDVSRSLEFSQAAAPRVLPENSIVDDTTRMVSVYARTMLRPWRRVRISGEVGYRAAPEIGYVTDLGHFGYGRVDARWVLATSRPVVLTAFVRGDGGRNDEFEMVDGLGPDPAGPGVDRSFERWTLGWGVGAETSPIDRLSLYASFVCGRINQDTGVMLSTAQRYFQDAIPLTFTDIGGDGFENQQKSLILGLSRDWRHGFDSGVSYTYTFARAKYETGGSQPLDLIAAERQIDNQTQLVNFEAGWRPRRGLRLLAGYRLQWNKDGVAPPQSIASSVAPIGNGTYQHTFTLGASLDGSFFDRDGG